MINCIQREDCNLFNIMINYLLTMVLHHFYVPISRCFILLMFFFFHTQHNDWKLPDQDIWLVQQYTCIT